MSRTWTTTCSPSSPSGRPPGPRADLAHVEECERCADELAALRERRRARTVGRSRRPARRARAAVWDRVADELQLPPAVPALGRPSTRPPEPSRRRPPPAGRRRARPPHASTAASWRWIAGAAAAGLLVGGGGAGGGANRDEPVTVLATATLEPLPGWDASGSAVVETSADGTRVLVVDLDRDRCVRRRVPGGLAAQAGRRAAWSASAPSRGRRAGSTCRRGSTSTSTRWSTCPRSSSTGTPRTRATRSCGGRCRCETPNAADPRCGSAASCALVRWSDRGRCRRGGLCRRCRRGVPAGRLPAALPVSAALLDHRTVRRVVALGVHDDRENQRERSRAHADVADHRQVHTVDPVTALRTT